MRAGGFDLAVIDLGLSPARWIARSAWEPARLFRVCNPSAPLVVLAAELRRDLEAEAACVCPVLVLEKPINMAHLRAVARQLPTESARGWRASMPGVSLFPSDAQSWPESPQFSRSFT
jgi:hypothetical protein